MAAGDIGAGAHEVQKITEATMKRVSSITRVIPLLIGLGLFLSACAVQPGGYVYDGYPSYPVYGAFDFDDGGWGGWHHGWDHSHWDHAGFRGHGGDGHGGGGEHAGGGHR